MTDDDEMATLLKPTETLGERLAASRQLGEAWARVDDHYAEFRAVSVAVARVDPADRSVDTEPQVRMAAHARELISAVAAVETLALRLAGSDHGPRRAETLMATISRSLTAAEELQQEIREVEDLELRRLVGAFGDHLKRARLAFAELERYLKRVYGEGK